MAMACRDLYNCIKVLRKYTYVITLNFKFHYVYMHGTYKKYIQYISIRNLQQNKLNKISFLNPVNLS